MTVYVRGRRCSKSNSEAVPNSRTRTAVIVFGGAQKVRPKPAGSVVTVVGLPASRRKPIGRDEASRRDLSHGSREGCGRWEASLPELRRRCGGFNAL